MLTRWHIPKGWPSEQQEILRRLQQSPTSQPEETVRTVVEFLCPEALIGPADQEFLAQSRRFRAVRNTRSIQIECLHATVHRREEFRTSRPDKKTPLFLHRLSDIRKNHLAHPRRTRRYAIRVYHYDVVRTPLIQHPRAGFYFTRIHDEDTIYCFRIFSVTQNSPKYLPNRSRVCESIAGKAERKATMGRNIHWKNMTRYLLQ